MEKPFRHCWLKIERAKKHIGDFDDAIRGFNASNPYEVFFERDTKSHRMVMKARRLKAPPEALALIAGDAIHNLRAALDYLVGDLAAREGNSREGAAFPFAKEAEHFNSGRVQGKVRHLSIADRERINALEPFNGGKGTLLFALHDLDRVDKHITLSQFNAGSAGVHIQAKLADKIRLYKPGPFGADDVVPILSFAPDANFEGSIQPSIRIGFAEPEAVKGEPVGGTLNYFLRTVSDIVLQFE